jgi:hypothetical protein
MEKIEVKNLDVKVGHFGEKFGSKLGKKWGFGWCVEV